MEAQKIVFAGFGGQGIMLIGQLLAYAAMLDGKEVTWMPSYGPEMRGGTANCTVIISDKKIASPLITQASAAAVMNDPSFNKFEGFIEPGGYMFVNTSLIHKKPARSDIEIYDVDCNAIAESLGNQKVANMVMLGAVARAAKAVSFKSLEKGMEKIFTGSKAGLIPINKSALNAWKKTPATLI